MSEINSSYAKFLNRKGVGKLLKKVNEEYDMSVGCDLKIHDTNTKTVFTYTLTNRDLQRINFVFSFYVTGWTVSITTAEGYSSEHLGVFAPCDHTFSSSKELLEYMEKCKFARSTIINGPDNQDSDDVLNKIKQSMINLMQENLTNCICDFSNKTKNVFDKVVDSINSYFIENDETTIVFKMFEFFEYLDNALPKCLFKDIALYITAKEIFSIKNKMLFEKPDDPIFGHEIQATSQAFAYAHALQFYGGKCKWLHGHNGKIVIKATVSKDTLKNRPMFLSYGFLKGFLKNMDNLLDHKTFWALNPNHKYTLTPAGYKVSTEKQTVIFHDEEGHVLFPFFPDASPFSTSEITLNNYVIPQFYIYLARFILKNTGPDSTNMAFSDLSELIRYSFSWYETDETVCTLHINV